MSDALKAVETLQQEKEAAAALLAAAQEGQLEMAKEARDFRDRLFQYELHLEDLCSRFHLPTSAAFREAHKTPNLSTAALRVLVPAGEF